MLFDIWLTFNYFSISRYLCGWKWTKQLCLDDRFTENFNFNIYQFIFFPRNLTGIQIELPKNWIIHCSFGGGVQEKKMW